MKVKVSIFTPYVFHCDTQQAVKHCYLKHFTLICSRSFGIAIAAAAALSTADTSFTNDANQYCL